jgi:hypothetical protein
MIELKCQYGNDFAEKCSADLQTAFALASDIPQHG